MARHIVNTNKHNISKSEFGYDDELLDMFGILNKKHFNNELPFPGGIYYKALIPKKNSRNTGGMFYYFDKTSHKPEDCCVTVSIEYRLAFETNMQEIWDILLHEMTHYWCYYKGKQWHDNDLDFQYKLGWVHAYPYCAPFPKDLVLSNSDKEDTSYLEGA